MTSNPSQQDSEEYVAARRRLNQAEIDLKDRRERVAALRRDLPPGRVVEDYELTEMGEDGPAPVRLSWLFDDPEKSLVLIQLMYGGAQTKPCPMCTMWADGYDAVARHLKQRCNLAIVAEADISDFKALAEQRDWTNLRLISSAGTTFKVDFEMADSDGSQSPGISVFALKDGLVRHFYSGHAQLAEGHWRGLDLLSPVWNLFDLLPEGRGNWMPSVSYDD